MFNYTITSPVQEVQSLTPTAVATAGTFTLTFQGHTTAAIAFDATTADIQAALEALTNVSAGDITVGGTSLDTAGATTFTFASDAGDVELISIDPGNLTPSAASNYVMAEDTKGIDGWISRSSNTIDDVISGVTLHLHDTTESAAPDGYDDIEVNLTRDTEALKEKVEEMVTAYNAAVMFIQEKTKFSTDKNEIGIFATDYHIRTIWDRIKEPFNSQANGFSSKDTFVRASDIGLKLDADGMLELDSNTFDEAVVDDYLGVLSIIGAIKTGYTADSSGESGAPYMKFLQAGTSTTAGKYHVQVVISGGGAITSAKIWTDGETIGDARDATIDGSVITGNTSLDSNSKEFLYPENNLQLNIDLTQTGQTLTTTVYVRQGFAGAAYDVAKEVLDSSTGTVPITQKALDKSIEYHNARIDREKVRLATIEERLIQRFARMESFLQTINSQMGALNGMS